MARGLVTGVAGRLRAARPSPVPADGRSANVSRGYAAIINWRQRISDLLRTSRYLVRQPDLLQEFYYRSEPDILAFRPAEHRVSIARIKSAESYQFRAASSLGINLIHARRDLSSGSPITVVIPIEPQRRNFAGLAVFLECADQR